MNDIKNGCKEIENCVIAKGENTTINASAPTIQFHVNLRDYFAAMALAGISQDCMPERTIPIPPPSEFKNEAEVAAWRAYMIADAMISEREK